MLLIAWVLCVAEALVVSTDIVPLENTRALLCLMVRPRTKSNGNLVAPLVLASESARATAREKNQGLLETPDFS